MGRSKTRGDFHSGLVDDHERGVAEDVRISKEGRGPGNAARRVRQHDDDQRFNRSRRKERKSKE